MAESTLKKVARDIGAAIGRAERTARDAQKVAGKKRKQLEKKARAVVAELKKSKKYLDRAIAKARA